MADTPGGSEPADIGTAETTTTLGEDLLPAAEEEAGEERGANSSPGTGEIGKIIWQGDHKKKNQLVFDNRQQQKIGSIETYLIAS